MFFPIGEEVIGLCMTKEVTGGVEDGAGKTVGNTCTALVDERTYVQCGLKDNFDLSTDECINWVAKEELGRLVEKTMFDRPAETD